MQIKNLFDTSVKQEMIDRINQLTPETKAHWGKMDVAQMLAHCQMPLGVATGKHQLKGRFFMRLIGPLFKSLLVNETPFKKNLGTDKSFIMNEPKDFEKEKQGLIQMINDFNATSMTDAPHPIFGKMTKEEWSKGTWKHLDHHFRQFGV